MLTTLCQMRIALSRMYQATMSGERVASYQILDDLIKPLNALIEKEHHRQLDEVRRLGT